MRCLIGVHLIISLRKLGQLQIELSFRDVISQRDIDYVVTTCASY